MKKLATLLALALFVGAAAAQPQSQNLKNPGQTPGNALYGLDRAMESVELTIARAIGGQERAAKVRANHAEERLSEAQKLAESNRTDDIERLMQDYDRNMNAIRNSSAELNDTEFQERVQNMTNKHVQVLERVQQQVPEQAQQGIQRALENSRKPVPGPRAGPPEGVPGRPDTSGNSSEPGNGQGPAAPENRTEGPPEDRTGDNQNRTEPENSTRNITGNPPAEL